MELWYRYTLLVGKPPFETSSLRETYVRISRNDYRVPSSVSASARSLIHRLLHPDPQCRPSMEDVLRDQFLVSGIYVRRLTLSSSPSFYLNQATSTHKQHTNKRQTDRQTDKEQSKTQYTMHHSTSCIVYNEL